MIYVLLSQMTKFTLTIYYVGSVLRLNISTADMFGFWMCQFNRSIWAWGLSLSALTKYFVWLFKFNVYVVQNGGWWGLRLELHQVLFEPISDRYVRLGVPWFVNVLIFWPSFWCVRLLLNCTKHKGHNSNVIQWNMVCGNRKWMGWRN